MKHLPNSVTLLRFLCTFGLYFIEPWTAFFYLTYIIAGLSDWIDGWIARQFNLSTPWGALLDSLADSFYFITLVILSFPLLASNLFSLLLLILITVTRTLSVIAGYLKHHRIIFLHTYGNKLSGLLIFLLPFLVPYSFFTTALLIVLTLSLLFSLEEFYLIFTQSKVDLNVKSILKKNP